MNRNEKTQNFLHEGLDIAAEIAADNAAYEPNSWAPEVIADNSGNWCGNALRFATKKEAEDNVRDLSCRWTSVKETRVVESTDPANYRWTAYGLEKIS